MMKRNLLDKQAADEVISRVQSLKITDKAHWGAMEVTEMLHHCYMANKNILENEPDNPKATLKQVLIKTLFLYILPAFPKNVKGPKRIDPKLSKILPDQFEEKRSKLLQTIQQFSERKTPIEVTHPFFGKLNTKQWGVFTWMHMDHHLRQFGV